MILNGDVVDMLDEIESNTVQACITSPPYWNLRDYDNDNFPNLDVIKNKRLINKLEKNKSHTIENLKVLSLNIILEAGFKHKY